jgi:hypothetical protein
LGRAVVGILAMSGESPDERLTATVPWVE